MVEESIYIKAEAEAKEIFFRAGWVVEETPNHERIELIINKAHFQNIMKDAAAFLFLGFGSALTGLSSAAFGSVTINDIDYRA